MMKKILLVCGTGASSGFMAKNIRKAAKEKGMELSIKARSDAEVDEYIEEIDLLLIGPHLKYMVVDLKEIAKPHQVPVHVITEEAYGALDGAKMLAEILSIIEL